MTTQPYTDVSSKMSNFDNKGTQYAYIVTDGSTDSVGRNLRPGQALVTPDGAYTLFFQTDGNLVLYRGNDFTSQWLEAVWDSGVYFKGDHLPLLTNSILGTEHGRLQTVQLNGDGTIDLLWQTGKHDLDVDGNQNGDAILLLLRNDGAWGQATSGLKGVFDNYNYWNISSDGFSPHLSDPITGYQIGDVDLDIDNAIITSNSNITSVILNPKNNTSSTQTESVTLSLTYTKSTTNTLSFQEGVSIKFSAGKDYKTAGPVETTTKISIEITGSFTATETTATTTTETKTFTITQGITEAPNSSYQVFMTASSVSFEVPMSYDGLGIYRSGARADIDGTGFYRGTDAIDFVVEIDGPLSTGASVASAAPVAAPVDPEDGVFFTFYEGAADRGKEQNTTLGASEELVRQHVAHGTHDIAGKTYALVEQTANWGRVDNLMLKAHEFGARAATDWVVANFVDVRASFVKAAAGADVMILGLKRGEIVTGDGDDRVVTTLMSDEGSEYNKTAIATGDGDDRVVVMTVRSTRQDDRLLRDNDDDANGALWNGRYNGSFSKAVVTAGDGDDAILVRNRIDAVIDGGEGGDRITGGRGNDMIDGGAGADVLRGRGGADVFVLRAGEVDGDVIVNFRGAGIDGGDALRLEGFESGNIVALGHGRFRIDHLVDDGPSPPAVVREVFTIKGVATLGSGDYDFV